MTSETAEITALREELQKMSNRFRGLLVDFENAQADVVAKNRIIGQLKAQIAKLESDEDPTNQKTRAQADAVFAYWNDTCKHGRAREFTDERQKAVLARLAGGQTLDAIFTAIDGAAAYPFISEGGKRHDELELICRNGSKFDSFRERGEKYRADVEERFERALAVAPDARDPERVAFLQKLAESNVVQLPTVVAPSQNSPSSPAGRRDDTSGRQAA